MKLQRKTLGLMCCILLLWGWLAPVSRAELTSAATILWVDDDYRPGRAGWNVTHFASLSEGLAAVQAGGTINIMPGLYVGPFDITKPGVTLHGLGHTPTIILHGNSAPCAVSVSAANVTLKGLTITGGGIQGLRLAGADGTRIENCTIQSNTSVGISIQGGWDYVIKGNDVLDNQDAGVSVGIHLQGEVGNSVLQGNRVLRHYNTLEQGTGILVENGGRDIEITGNTVAYADYGIRLTNSNRITVAGNEVSRCRYSGIHIQDAYQITIRQNWASHNGGSGILFVGTTPDVAPNLSVAEGNICQDNGAAGIYAYRSSHISLARNACLENALHGIALESSFITLTANSLLDNRYDGLRIYAVEPSIARPLTGIVVRGNSLLGNQRYGLYTEAAAAVDATGNWWGRNLPQVGTDVVGNVLYNPWMVLSLRAEPQAVPIGGAPARIQAFIGGGGYVAPDGAPISLETSAGTLEAGGELVTQGGQVSTLLYSEEVVGSALITATAESASAMARVEFYNPDDPLPPKPQPAANSGAITGYAWVDLDGDGEREEGEPPLAGARIALRPQGEPTAPPTSACTTADDGSYTFSGVTVGSYCLTALMPPGYLPAQRTQCAQVDQGAVLHVDWAATRAYLLALPLVSN